MLTHRADKNSVSKLAARFIEKLGIAGMNIEKMGSDRRRHSGAFIEQGARRASASALLNGRPTLTRASGSTQSPTRRFSLGSRGSRSSFMKSKSDLRVSRTASGIKSPSDVANETTAKPGPEREPSQNALLRQVWARAVLQAVRRSPLPRTGPRYSCLAP